MSHCYYLAVVSLKLPRKEGQRELLSSNASSTVTSHNDAETSIIEINKPEHEKLKLVFPKLSLLLANEGI